MERFRPTRARAGHREAARLANTKQRKTRIAVSSTSMELAHGPRAHVRADRARRRARPCQRNNRTHAFAFSEPSAALASSEQLWQWLGIRLSATVAVFAVYYIFFVPIQQTKGDTSCPKCGGTGKVECMCTRWSDGDVGCPACEWTGWAPCNNCGGGGLKRPLTADLYARTDDDGLSG